MPVLLALGIFLIKITNRQIENAEQQLMRIIKGRWGDKRRIVKWEETKGFKGNLFKNCSHLFNKKDSYQVSWVMLRSLRPASWRNLENYHYNNVWNYKWMWYIQLVGSKQKDEQSNQEKCYQHTIYGWVKFTLVSLNHVGLIPYLVRHIDPKWWDSHEFQSVIVCWKKCIK